MADLPSLLSRNRDAVALVGTLADLEVFPRSFTTLGDSILFMGRQGRARQLGLLTSTDSATISGFDLEYHPVSLDGVALSLGLGDLSPRNAAALRAAVAFTESTCLGLSKSVGLGDRLGIATPGHIRALRRTQSNMRPILAQQSIREMERTARTPQQVIDAATWGVLQEGWTEGYGSDADHLKTREDIDACAAVGFKLYTLDPREYVDNTADSSDMGTLMHKIEKLPWGRLETTFLSLLATYVGKRQDLGANVQLVPTDQQIARAACKYGRAIAFLVEAYRYLVVTLGQRPFEVEISIDETDTPTKPVEHLFIASELRRLGVRWVSLAPRYVGRFEKGVDYIGDLTAFEADFAQHAAIARALGPYKLSLHSGSDKFSIYPIAARLAGELVHLKTAGTSYLEALRAVACTDSALFREILAFAAAHYEQDRASYHVSAQLARMLNPDTLSDEQLVTALDQFDTRQALHVTFGTVLTAKNADGSYRFRDQLYDVLACNEEVHYAALETHLARHLQPFAPTIGFPPTRG